MKKMKKILYGILFGAMLCCGWASCDEDNDLSADIIGTWKGDFSAFYLKDSSDLANSDTCWATVTLLSIMPEYPNAHEGTGFQRDYYHEGSWPMIETTINWEFVYGKLYIEYRDQPDRDIVIYDYTLNDSTFVGWYGSFPWEHPFDLRKDK